MIREEKKLKKFIEEEQREEGFTVYAETDFMGKSDEITAQITSTDDQYYLAATYEGGEISGPVEGYLPSGRVYLDAGSLDIAEKDIEKVFGISTQVVLDKLFLAAAAVEGKAAVAA